MSYSIRRWFSACGILYDDSDKAKTAEEAIEKAVKISGICKDFINDGVKEQIRNMEVGETIKIRKPSVGFTIRIRRTKR